MNDYILLSYIILPRDKDTPLLHALIILSNSSAISCRVFLTRILARAKQENMLF